MARKMTPEEIIAAVEAEEALALDSSSGQSQLNAERTDAMERYRGLPLGNEIEGRSQVVDRSIADCIEWIMPSLVRIYLGGDDIGMFQARGPEDEEAAKTETDVVNWYITQKNDFYSQINATLRDALLLKNGYIVAYWRTAESVETETYIGQSDEETTLLMQDEEIKVLEHTQYMDPDWQAPDPQILQQMAMQAQMQGQNFQPPQCPMLHDLKVERKRAEEYVAVESIPPDEMRVSKRHRWTSLMDSDFTQWVRRVSVGQLRAEGFKVGDEDGMSSDTITGERVARDRYNENSSQDETSDPARRIVTFKDTLMRLDVRGEGQAQLWRICRVDGAQTPCLCEEADVVNFAAFSPIIFPHSHVGTSVYDLIADLGVIKTTLQRQFLDSMYLQTSGRMAADINRLPSLDDLLVSRPGGIVRTDGPPGEVLLPLASPDAGASIMQGLEYIDGIKEQRTGVTRYSAGLDANTLNKTATGIQSIQSAANQRIELIARTLASGFRDLFCIVHALALKHSTKPVQVKLNNKWITVNPREWRRRTDFTINVGLGIGSPDAQLAKLKAMEPDMQAAMQMGLAGPQEVYNFGVELWKAAGYKNPDKFLHPPPTGPDGKPVPPPQKDDPLVEAQKIKSDGEGKVAQMKAQLDMQMKQAEMQAKNQAEQARALADIEVKKAEVAAQAQIEQVKAQYQQQFDQYRHDSEQQTKIKIAEIQSATSLEVARISRGIDDGLAAAQQALDAAYGSAAATLKAATEVMQTMQAAFPQLTSTLQAHTQAMQAHAQLANTPKRIVRDPMTGRATGIVADRTLQ